MARSITGKLRVRVSDAARMICERAVTEKPGLFETHVGNPLTHLPPAERIQVKNVGIQNAAVPVWQFVYYSERVIPRTFQVFHFDRKAIGKAFGLTHEYSYADALGKYFKNKLKELGRQAKHVECHPRVLGNGNVLLFVFERAAKPPLRTRLRRALIEPYEDAFQEFIADFDYKGFRREKLWRQRKEREESRWNEAHPGLDELRNLLQQPHSDANAGTEIENNGATTAAAKRGLQNRKQ